MAVLKDLHILIAEDDIDDSEMILESFLAHPAFIKVMVVKNGKELLDLLKDENERKPDIILTDINMPLVNGLEALKAIQRDPALKDIATFAYSTSTTSLYINKCLEFGARFFFPKPAISTDFYQIPEKLYEVLSGKIL